MKNTFSLEEGTPFLKEPRKEEPLLRPSEIRIISVITIFLVVGISAVLFMNQPMKTSSYVNAFDTEGEASVMVKGPTQNDIDICKFAANLGTSDNSIFKTLQCKPTSSPSVPYNASLAICSDTGSLGANFGNAFNYVSGKTCFIKCNNRQMTAFHFESTCSNGPSFTISGNLGSIPSSFGYLTDLTLASTTSTPISGTIPTSIGSTLTALSSITVNGVVYKIK